jgi:uncharacterized protein (DUF1810 family)
MVGSQTISDSYNLQRFVDAQNPVYPRVLEELRAGHKQSHWIWFIFPQIKGLGSSTMNERFSISSRQEAAAYLAHPVLGPRLHECTSLVNLIQGRSAHDVFGYPDDLKFRSSMTLFANVAPDNAAFTEALARYYDSEPDPRTLELLRVGPL